MSILLVGGLDQTGNAGLARDIAVATKLGLHPCPVATCLTRNDTVTWSAPPDDLQAALQAAYDKRRPAWMKVGVVVSRSQAEAIAGFAKRTGIRFVHDPVLAATSGTVFARPSDLEPLLAHADLVTPNEDEAHGLGLDEGDRVHVTRGGDLPGDHHGTGCRFATHVACLLAHGLDRSDALEAAHVELEHELSMDVQQADLGLDPQRRAHLDETRHGLHALLRVLSFDNIPEVGTNFAYALPGARSPRDVCGLAGRITIAGSHRDWTGRIAFGGPHHTGRIAVVLQEYDPDARCVMNHRFDEAFIEAGRAAGLTDAEFKREDEPVAAPSTMEWGVRDAIHRHGGVPDLIWDRGGVGKEAMIRVIGRNPVDVARKVRLMSMQNRRTKIRTQMRP